MAITGRKVAPVKKVNPTKLAKGTTQFSDFTEISCGGRVAERNKKTRSS
jgi:hypothetical protein